MSFDDLISEPSETKDRVCDRAGTCKKENCLHRYPHETWELGRPEQPETDAYEDNWDCAEIECSNGGICTGHV